MKNKYFFKAVIMTIILILLTACSQGGGGEKAVDIEANIDLKKTEGESSVEEKGQSIPIIREDKEKLVKVAINDGEATISFDFDRWEQLHQLKENAFDFIDTDAMEEGPFPMKVESGKVVDAYIGKIQSISFAEYEFIMPTVVLLMEDGSLEWFFADPYNTIDLKDIGGEYEDYENFTSMGKLSHKDDYVSFSYESDGEGYGNDTIYIRNSVGEKFDFRYLLYETNLTFGTWVCSLPPGDYMHGFITFSEDGTVKWEIGDMDEDDINKIGQAYEIWEGIYEFIKTDDREYPIGTLLLDMGGWWIYEGEGDLGYEGQIKSSYRTDFSPSGDLVLYYNDGVDLYQFKKNHKRFDFWNHYDYEEDYDF